MQSGLTIEGAKELEAMFAKFNNTAGRKGIRRAVRTAHRVVLDQIKANVRSLSHRHGKVDVVPLRSRMLKALKLRAARKQQAGRYKMDVLFADPEANRLVHYPKGASTSLGTKKTMGTRSFVPAALQFGHGANKQEAAVPFFSQAVDQARQRCQMVLQEELKKELIRLRFETGQ